MLPWGSNIHAVLSPTSGDSRHTFGAHGSNVFVIHSPAFL